VTARALLRQATVFVAIWAVGLAAVHLGKRLTPFNAPFFWPISIFKPRWPAVAEWLALAAAAALCLLALRLEIWRRGRAAILLAGTLFVLVGTLGQGWEGGFARPVAGLYGGEGIQYYHAAMELTGPGQALHEFNALQPSLRNHSATHPPGALLLYWALAKALKDPALIGLVLGILSLLLSGLLLHRFLSRFMLPERVDLLLWLFFLLPAVQIYYVSCLDALIAGCFLGCLVYFDPGRGWLRLLPALAFLLLSAWLTFAFVYLLPVLAWVELRTRRSLLRSAVLGIAAALALLALKPLIGLDYFGAFFTATRLDNPDGWPPLAHFRSYAATRVENVAEILLFLGPFVLTLIWQGWRRGHGEWREWTRGSLLCLAAVFLSGAFKTGETARTCLFVLPALLLPLAAAPTLAAPGTARRLSLLVAAQALVMQAFGSYFW
jgi:hypothetical protein